MSTRKIVYSRSELFEIRTTLGLDPLPAATDPPSLPLFRAHGATSAHGPANGLEGSGNAQGTGFGSWRDGGGFGSSSAAVRRTTASIGALHSSPSGSDLPTTTTTVQQEVQWVYRTKGRTNKSNPMSIKEIEQLVADELVDSDEIELSRVGSTGADAFISFTEAQEASATTSITTTSNTTGDVDHGANLTAPMERWRPGSSANAERKAHQRPPHGSATAGLSSSGILERRSQQPQQQHNHLPPKHLSISRDDMLAADDLRRRSPCAVPTGAVAAAVTPPSTSPMATILPTPIDVGALALDEHLGLGTVPTPNAGSSLHPFPPQAPCALDIDQEAYAAVSPSGKRTSQTPKSASNSSETPTKMRPPPPPVLCVDEPAALVDLTSEVVTIATDTHQHKPAVTTQASEEQQVASRSPAKGDASRDKKAARSPAKGQKKSPVPAAASQVSTERKEKAPVKPESAGAATPAPNAPQSSKKNVKGSRGATAAVSPTAQQPADKANIPATFVDPAIVAQGPAAPVVSLAAAGSRPITPEPLDADQKSSKADRKREAAKKAAANAAPWGNNADTTAKSPTTKHSDTGKQQQRRSKQTSPAQPTPPLVDTSLYPTMEEIMSGDVKPAKAAPRQIKTLASIVAEGGRGIASSPVVDGPSAAPKQQQPQQQKKSNPSAGRGKGSK
jgi:hypothetical protein